MMNNKKLYKGIVIMLCSSLFTCTGQLCWKLSAVDGALPYILFGFVLYGLGALMMIFALKFGDLSVLHPMLGIGYVLSIVLGSLVLGESIELKRIIGIVIILFGLVCLARSDRKE